MKKIDIILSVMKSGLLLLFCSFFYTGAIFGQLSGTYTIGTSGSEDYTTVSDAVSALITQGISGPVVFNISDGEYNEQFSIPEISGASETDTIVFQPASGDTTAVKIWYDPPSTDVNYTIKLAGADHLRFRNLSLFSAGSSAFGNIILFTDNTKDIIFSGNHFYGKMGSCVFKDKVLVRDDKASADTSIFFLNNSFEHGIYHLYIMDVTDMIVSGNQFLETDVVSMAVRNLEGVVIENNVVSGQISISPPFKGSASNVIGNNTIQGYLDVYGQIASEGKETKISNNFISGYLYLRSCDYTRVFHNTVVTHLREPLTVENTCDHITLMNNIFQSDNSAYAAVDIGELADIVAMDYNNLYGPEALVTLNAVDYNTLGDWQTASGLSANAKSQELSYADVANGDLHIAAGNPDLYGTPLSDYKYDIDGDFRNFSTPNIGADEYSNYPPMSGVYTIGKNGTEDFSSFCDAVAALSSYGVSGPCYFNVSAGTYDEQFSIPEIPGASEEAIIYFSSETYSLNTVYLTCKLQDINSRGIVDLNGADYIYFHYINFAVAEESDYGIVFNFRNGASHNEISVCHFTGMDVGSSGGVYSIIYSGDFMATTDEYNAFKNNTFINGSHGIYLAGKNEGTPEKGNEITNNRFMGQFQTGINLSYQDSCTISRDSITISSPSSNPAGIYLYGCQKEMVFYNTISVSSSSASAGGYGLHIHNGNALAEGSAFIINNFISLSSNAEVVAFGILLRNSPDRKIYSNTINISGSNSLSQSFRAWESSENFSAHNNIFANHAGGHAFSSDAAINFTSDYNDLYTSGSMLTPDYSTLDQWQTATSKDQHSISVVPGFISNDDLHIDHACADLNGAGKITLTGNPKIDFCMGRDIDLEVRDAASPDIGADEYTYISEKKDFLTYGFNDQTGDAIINTDEHTISAEVEYGTDLSSLVAMFAISENASVAIGMETQTSGVTVNDFTSPVVYTVTAEDGTEQDWTVTVTCALNDSTGILAYSLDEQTGTADIDANNHTIEIEVPFNTDLTQLVAGFVLSTGASASVDGVSQESDVTVNDFTSPAIYTVTAENGTEQEWTITVTKTPNAENDILSFSFAEQSSEATIDAGNHSIEIQVVYGTDLTSLVASFTISEGAAISIEGISQESGVSINDFNTPVTYTIISQTNNSQEWIVSVTADEEVAFHEMTDLEFEIHPNPASNYVYIKSNLNMTDVLNIELIDITGCPQVMYRSCLYGDQVITMELSDGLADGLYFIKIKTAKRIFMQRIIIK